MPEQHPGATEKVLSFGTHTLFRTAKVLMDRGRPVRLGSRALDILIALAERAGEVVSKSELMSFAWPNTVVEENNLRVHMAGLRKILGDGRGHTRYIVNITGRGYSFVAPVTLIDVQPSMPTLAKTTALALPSPLIRIVGRDDLIKTLIKQMPTRRLLTIVGCGGIGKTTVSVAVAEQLAGFYSRVCFVDLSAVADPALVPDAMAAVLGISVHRDDPVASLTEFLRERRVLVLLDNCEHVIDTVATLIERVLRTAAGVDFIATSREPLRAEGEWLCNLPPLASPAISAGLQAIVALQYPAVALFVERAASGLENFELTNANVASVVSICRRLDGIPLAIELVAARVNMLGLDAISQGLGDELILAAKGRRTACSRHQSLRATLDWSYQLLSPVERLFLRQVAIFKGFFSAESASAVVSGSALAGNARLADFLMSLAAKNLLITDVNGPRIRYRLLHVARAYASERLTESDDQDEIARRHAEHVQTLIDSADDDWEKMTRDQWLDRYGSLLDDARAAMDWAFGRGNNVELGAALTIGSLPFGFQLSQFDETVRRAYVALEALAHLTPPSRLWEIRINNALTGLLSSTGPRDGAVLAATARAVDPVATTGVDRYSVEPLVNRGVVQCFSGNFPAALKTAQQLEARVKRSQEQFARLIADPAGA